MTHKTLGSIIADLSGKTPETRDPIEIEREVHKKNYIDNFMATVERGRKRFPGDFFIHIELKAEKLLANTFRYYFMDKLACPTPNYDQRVYKYYRNRDDIELVWCIPDRETSHHLLLNALEVVPEERQLLNFVLQFSDGTLFKLCKQLNGEKLETPELN